MWTVVKSWIARNPVQRISPRRKKVVSGVAVENLESRQLLSATMGVDPSAAAETSVARHGRAVPRIDGVAGEYTFFNEPGTLTITQDGLSIHGVISAEHNPSGNFDAFFKKPQSKVARGTGDFLFQGDAGTTPVKVKFKFTPDGSGGFNFSYHYRELRVG